MTRTALFVTAMLAAAPAGALAANANNPYGNVDHRVDAGNNTGDAQVEQLNQAQLNGSGLPPSRTAQQGYINAPPARPAPPPGYAANPPPAPPGYAAPAYPAVPYPAPVYAFPYGYGYFPPPAAYVAYPFFYRRPFFYYPY